MQTKTESANVKKTNKKTRKKTTSSRKIGGVDISFLMILTALLLFGFLMVFSASYANALFYKGDSFYYAKTQLIFILIGAVFMFLAIKFVDYRLFMKWSVIILVLTIILLIMVWVPGVAAPRNTVHRWINIGISFQPSEAAKFSVILWFAMIAHNNQSRIGTFKYGVLPFGLILAPLVILVVLEPHLSGTIIILGIAVVMMFIAGTRIRYFVIVGIIGVIGLLAIMAIKGISPADLLKGYQLDRIENWKDPFRDGANLDDVWQTRQSLIAIGSGGLMGVGFGNSMQKYLYLPEPQNDFIFAIVCEELGLVGAFIVIILFGLLIWRGFVIASKAPDKFGSMLVIGIISQIAIQFLLNIAVVTNAIPNTGIGLPFFSAGGSSMVILMVEMGIVLNVSKHSLIEKPSEIG